MKLLRNPVVVGLLVVAAVALVAKSFWPMFNRGGARVIRGPTPTAPGKPAATPPATKPAVAQTQKQTETTTASAPDLRGPISEVEWAQVRTNATRWLESPRHDPFQVRDWSGQIAGGTNPPASAFLTLNGIWRQTGSTLAVINSVVLGEGDEILQFKIQSIESDRVWVYGPSGVEVLPFKPIGSEDATTEPKATGRKPPAPPPGAPPRTLR